METAVVVVPEAGNSGNGKCGGSGDSETLTLRAVETEVVAVVERGVSLA